MSAVLALVRQDGRSASTADLEPIAMTLAHRGPDGSGGWSEGAVALGHACLATTPQAAAETMPLRHEASGCVITADARLDNREELAAALGVDPRGKGDGELILLAYLRWAEEAPLHLLGDYAFIIWDGGRHRLLAVRDPVGMRQLHYAWQPGRLLALATDERALVAHPEVPVRLNEVRIADFLEDLEGADLTSTFFLGVERLPPAHLLLLEGGRLTVRRYWTLESPEPLRLGSDEAYAEAFLDIFGQAVASRLRSRRRVGAMLSGGLDSSAVAAVAARLKEAESLPVFSAVGAHPSCIETAMIRRVQAAGDFAPFEVRAPGHSRSPVELSPFDGSMALVAAIYRTAREAGCDTLLDGVAGDVVLDHRNWTARLLRNGHWQRAWAEMIAERHFWRGTPGMARLMLDTARGAFLPDWARKAKRVATCRIGRIRPRSDLLRDDFARRIDVAARRDRLSGFNPSPALPYAEDRRLAFLHPNLVVGRERYDRVASLYGIEPRDPFLDLRLVRFSLSLPPEQLTRDGWTKRIVRVAMDEILPDEVRWRRGKEHLGSAFITRAFEAERTEWTAALEEQRERLQEWVRPERLGAKTDPASWSCWPQRNISYLAQWLHNGSC